MSAPAQTIRPRERNREFDIVLFGATGFTGELTAEVLAADGGELRWAIAGRNARKLEDIKARLLRSKPSLGDVATIVADSNDSASLHAMAARTEVVCTTVGPYQRYGEGLVAACVDEQTDYCDLTGEVQFVRRMIDSYHDKAEQQGARIVHFCGFDSIPSDLGTLLLQETFKERYGQPCEQVHYYLYGASGGFSGGTIASMSEMMEEIARDPSIRKVLGDPYGLNPKDAPRGRDRRDEMKPAFAPDISAWTGPFVMAPVNTRVVRRSNALLEQSYGENFRYNESMRTGRGFKGQVKATALTAAMAGFTGLMAIQPTRELLHRFVLPDPGEGPSRDEIERGFFEVRLVGQGRDEEGRPQRLDVTVRAERDPGYGATAIMLANAAACLALDGNTLDSAGGILTPASSMGMTLVDRLRDAGMTFDVRN